MRRALLIGVLFIILLIAGLSYYRMVVISSNSRPVYDALPPSTALFFEFRDFAKTSKILNTASFSREIKKTGFITVLQEQIGYIDSIFEDSKYTVSGNKTLAALYFTKEGQYDYLYLMELRNVVDRDMKIALRGVTDSKKAKVTERVLREETIYDITLPGSGRTLSCTFTNGVLICSLTPFLIDEAIKQVKDGKSIADEAGFDDLQKVAGENADATVFVRFSRIGLLNSLVMNTENDAVFPFLEKFAGWSAADITIKSNSFIVNGYTATGDSANSYLSQFTESPPEAMNAIQVLPNNTAIFFHKQVANKQQESDPVEYTYIRSWAGSDAVFGISEPFDAHIEQEYFLAITSNNDEQALASLTELGRLAGDSSELMEYSGHKIGRLRVGRTVTNFFDDRLLNISDPYFTILKGAVVLANNENTLKNLIVRNMNGQTLVKTQRWQKFSGNLASKYNFMVYADPSRCAEIINTMMAGPILDVISLSDQSYRKFTPIAIQFSREDDNYFTTGFVNFQEKVEDITNEIWRSRLDTSAITQPFIVMDSARNELQILVQDAKYDLYLINKAGRIVWKKNIGAPLKGKVYPLDLYKDGRQQFAFNTVKELHMLDQKGEYVESYPIKFPSPASNGILVTDQTGTRDYRIFVACTNFSIYGYDGGGKPLPGWSPQAKAGSVSQPLEHIKIDTVDYYIAVNSSGTLIYYNTAGKRLMEPIRLEKQFKGAFSFYITDTSFIAVNADAKGDVYVVNHRGEKTVITPDSLKYRSFRYIQNSMAGGHYVFVDTFNLRVYDQQLQKTQDVKVPSPIDAPGFTVEIPGVGKGIGLVSREHNKIYLFYPDFTLADGFPLEGATAFDIALLNKNEEKILVTTDREGTVTAYRLK